MKKNTRTRALVRSLISVAVRPFGTVTHASCSEPLVAMTFDDGPHPDGTPRILQVLEEHNARGTFFMVGKAAAEHTELVERVAAGGHAIGNHTWDHPSFPLLDSPARRSQIRRCAETLAPHGDPIFRPPYGHQSLRSRRDVVQLGYQPVTWSIIAEDWAGTDADTLFRQVEERLAPGSIVVFHDALFTTDSEANRDRGPTVEALDRLLEKYRSHYRFVTVPELLKSGRARYWPWFMKSDTEVLENLI